ncbi:MAG: hypothetical protein PVH77_01720 [Phycisphaerales bacterium]|jgi:hypothetical protein
MEPEMNSENWQQPEESQNQSQPYQSYQPQYQPNSFLQQTWLNIKVSTWLKCLVVAFVLSFAAVFIAPKITQASKSEHQQQQTSDFYSEEDYWYDNYYGSED